MQSIKGINIGAWFLVALNMLIALGAISVFTRMSPAIAEIIEKNGKSLQLCENLLSIIAKIQIEPARKDELTIEFVNSLKLAKKNITESDEPDIIAKITTHYPAALANDKKALLITIEAIQDLAQVNRLAMVNADKNARRLGQSGAWGVVFMALCSFLASIIFNSHLNKRILIPVEEIKSVFIAHLNGEVRRRCSGKNLAPDIKTVFDNINSVLDNSQSNQF